VVTSCPGINISIPKHVYDVNVSLTLILEESYEDHCTSQAFHVSEGTHTHTHKKEKKERKKRKERTRKGKKERKKKRSKAIPVTGRGGL
jgi:hypothetical protein